ncbi:MAG TPA: hypothetical protein VFR18_21250 [Terriglobia bacterium]|nr:hypothetical protein [Terriglobia bacterium]
MRTKLMALVGAALCLGFPAAIGAGEGPQAGRGAAGTGSCDRACLQGFVDQYLDAWVARDPKRLPLAPNVRFTENGQRLELGDGSWNVATGKGKYRLWVVDAQTGQVALLTTVTEDGPTAGQNVASMLALRLKVANRQISEVEALFVRPATGGGNGGARGDGTRGVNDGARGVATPATPPLTPAERLEAMGSPNPIFMQPIPKSERMSRAELIRIANMYFSGMQQNDGLGEYPFTEDCDRFENASQATNVPTRPGQSRPDPKTANTYSTQWGCMEQFKSGLIHFVTRIRDRRYVAVDPEFGLVFSFVFFDHMAGKSRTYTRSDGRVITGGPTDPFTWEIAELFRIEKGKIRRIEAILVRSPYGQQSGWSTYEDSMSDRARDIK